MKHDHSNCIENAIEIAEDLCEKNGLRFTKIRRRVLELIWNNHEAIKAYDILELLQKDDVSAKPPTAYRALDFLLEHGFIHRIESLNSYIGCPHPEHTHNFQLLICNNCGLVKEMDKPDLSKKLNNYADEYEFKLVSQVIEVHGLCKDCYPTSAE
ncbi:MAG: Fur family zinc uptake transcriptional regulator [Enterobacterales bacterium]|jgi:Fur family zinc uptake transcriptional regulator